MEAAQHQISEGKYGAKVTSWRAGNPRDLLRIIMDENPTASKPELFAEFSKRVQHHQASDVLESVIEYWCVNNFNSLVVKHPQTTVVDSPLVATMRESIKTRAVNLVLMEFKMPNGKRLKFCTGAECTEAGGWLSKIGGRVAPEQVVGEVLTELDLHQLFQADS